MKGLLPSLSVKRFFWNRWTSGKVTSNKWLSRAFLCTQNMLTILTRNFKDCLTLRHWNSRTSKDKTRFKIIIYALMPLVHWHCWLGGRKGIRPVKKLSVGFLAWLSVWSEVQTCIRLSWCHCHSLSLAPIKSRLVLPFWYRLNRVVPDKGPLNECVCVCI